MGNVTSARYDDVSAQKASGSTYTPELLADFVAAQMLSVFTLPKDGLIRIMDPAVGDGALLCSLLSKLPIKDRKRTWAVGYDTDPEAIAIANNRLKKLFPEVQIQIEQKDFLTVVLAHQSEDLFATEKNLSYDLVIANPPYVRTQIIGAKEAQKLAKTFRLTGRVDLYYPFMLGISTVLSPQGVAGIITSNRFMTTKSGQAVRRALLDQFHVLHIWDLGDSKIFDAAVLPAIFLAKSKDYTTSKSVENRVKFSSVYQTTDLATISVTDVLKALADNKDQIVSIPDGRLFEIRHGVLDNGGIDDGVWRIGTIASDQWLLKVVENTWRVFRDLGKIRVGVKSTADKVFIRSDWTSLESGRPELLRPLITRHNARRFKSKDPEKSTNQKEILYPHESYGGKRSPVNLDQYPNSKAYLEGHKEALESRSYLIEAGRNWYELWVPHDPAAWSKPKLVFPDISEKPIFWIDDSNGVVNGECYWLQCDAGVDQSLLWLALAVANSEFIEEFYDHRFNNKLYAGRRRFITQYVEQFPLPDPTLALSQTIIKMAQDIFALTPSEEADQLALILNDLIYKAFGLTTKEISA